MPQGREITGHMVHVCETFRCITVASIPPCRVVSSATSIPIYRGGGGSVFGKNGGM